MLLERVLCSVLTRHTVRQRDSHAATPPPVCEIVNGENMQHCHLFCHPRFSRFYRVLRQGLILAWINQAREVDQTCFPCTENERGAYPAAAVTKKSKYDSFYSALCIDPSKSTLLSYVLRYRSGRS